LPQPISFQKLQLRENISGIRKNAMDSMPANESQPGYLAMVKVQIIKAILAQCICKHTEWLEG
jgi:hypothetical protein